MGPDYGILWVCLILEVFCRDDVDVCWWDWGHVVVDFVELFEEGAWIVISQVSHCGEGEGLNQCRLCGFLKLLDTCLVLWRSIPKF